MNIRSLLESLQLPVAVGGLVLLVLAVLGIVTLPPSPPESEGFVRGLTVLFLYGFAWVGFIVLSLGLAIPVDEGHGIRFTRYQRGLFVLAAVTAALGAFGPFLAFGLLLSNPSAMVSALLALMGLAVLSLSGGLLWRAGEWARTLRAEN